MKWNKYPDCKPENTGHYLVFFQDNVEIGYWSESTERWLFSFSLDDDGVTHWIETKDIPPPTE